MGNYAVRLLALLIILSAPAYATDASKGESPCPSYKDNWGLNEGANSIQICSARKYLTKPNAVKVAVVDSMVDDRHRFFNGRIKAVSLQDSHKFPASYVQPPEANETYVHHGTHISGIVHMVTTSALGADNSVEILAIRGFVTSTAKDPIKDTVTAFKHAIASGAQIINYSGGGTEPSIEEREAIVEAGKKGILVIVAAGNDGKELGNLYNYYPAGYGLSNVISVSSINPYGELLLSSNYGKNVDVSAPGELIRSTLPKQGFAFMTGTSQATAFVTGMASIILSQNPKLKPEEVKRIIKLSATKNKNAPAVGNKNNSRIQATAKPKKILKVRPPVVNAEAAFALINNPPPEAVIRIKGNHSHLTTPLKQTLNKPSPW